MSTAHRLIELKKNVSNPDDKSDSASVLSMILLLRPRSMVNKPYFIVSGFRLVIINVMQCEKVDHAVKRTRRETEDSQILAAPQKSTLTVFNRAKLTR